MIKLFQAISESIPVVLTRSADDKIVYINQNACDILEFSSMQEVKGHCLWDFFSTLLGDRDYYTSLFKDILNESGKVMGFEFPIENHKGKFIVLLLTMIPIEFEKKEFIVTFFCDITKYKDGYSVELQSLSHNLNNFLMVIQGYSEIGLEEIRLRKNSRKKKLEKYLEQSLFACYQANNLLQSSRGIVQQKKEFQLLDVTEVLERVLLLFQPFMKKLKVIRNIFIQSNTIMGDSIGIESVFMHLLLNAIESMPRGGILGIQMTNDTFENKNCIKLVISDTGEGISEEDQEKVFEVFFSTKQRGSGLGLSWVRQIVSLHKGSIHVKSREGEGSSFEIFLPLVTEGIGQKKHLTEKNASSF